MDDYTYKIEERGGRFWAVVCKTTAIRPGVHLRRITTQEEGPFDTHEEAERAGVELQERFEKLRAFW